MVVAGGGGGSGQQQRWEGGGGGGLVEGAESVAVTARDLRLQLVGCFISSPFFFLSLSLSLPRRRPAVFFSSARGGGKKIM